ncbi:multisubunit Na+/H+ antiporter MnhE subunit [Streptomyces sp. V2I9]|nr:multisubunit Na+/H+ antiporter MnhE subunit [Streptomyces sp. V2I9]
MVIGAAVVLFIASFLDYSSYCPQGIDCSKIDNPNAWDSLGLLMSVFLAGVIAAALVVVSRAMPGRKVAWLDLGQLGAALSLFTLWTAFWTILDISNAGAGLILGLLASIVLAAGAIAGPLVPFLKAPLLSPAAPAQGIQGGQAPYGAQPSQGYGYPGAQQQPYGAQPSQGYGYPGGVQQGQPSQGDPAHAQQAQASQPSQGGAAPAGDFTPFWFAVPVARPLYGEDGSPNPIAELAPGTWYLAVEQRGQSLIAQTQDGRRGVLQDTTGIQRG